MSRRSLKARITLLATAAAAALWLLAAALTWFEARHEAEELFDAHLAQAASLLIAQTGLRLEDDDDEALEEMHAPHLHRYGRQVAFQVWADGHLLLHSANAPAVPLGAAEGFSDSRVDGEDWRVFAAWNAGHRALVQVGERQAARRAVGREIAAGLLRPLLLALPLLAALIWLAVRRGMAPLERVAGEVAGLSPRQLAPLGTAGLPSEVRPLVERLNALLQRLARTFEQERRFTADAAHELRTPLAGLRAQVQVAMGAADDGARRQAFAAALQGCDRLAHLMEQLLVLARVDAARPADFVDLDLAAVAGEVIAQLADRALARDVDIELIAPAGVPMQGNPAWLAVLVRNLVDNAVGHSPPGGRVQVAVQGTPDGVQLEVDDTGPGVPPADLTHLGERFWRSLEGGRDDGGSGLGLSIVRRIAELHGGTVEFSNRAGQPGLSVLVRLPRSIEAGQGTPAA